MKKLIYILIITHYSLLITNCFSQWVQQVEPVSTPLYNVDFINRFTGWATGNSSVILKTTNGGINWIQQNANLSQPKSLYGLSVVNENTVYISGNGETIIKTTNGGINWTIILDGSFTQGNSFREASFINEMTGWICGFGGTVFRTTNGGLNWDSINVGTTGPLRDIQFVDPMKGWVCGDGGTLGKTTNGGFNWSFGGFLTGSNILSLHFINKDTGWAVSEQNKMVFKTLDGGTSWDTIAVLPGGAVDFLYSVYFTNPETGWVGGANTRLFKSTDGGYNWLQQVLPTPMFVWNLNFYNDSIGWATGGNNGVIIRTITGGMYVGIQNVGNIIPENFVLYQNYPNPFNSWTNIEFDITRYDNYSLEIYDMLGRKIETLFNKNLPPGKFKVTYDAFKLSSGIYIYVLRSSDNAPYKKFVLIK